MTEIGKAWLTFKDAPEAYEAWRTRVPAFLMYRTLVEHMPNPDVPLLAFLACSPGTFKCAFDPEQWVGASTALRGVGVEIRQRMAASKGVDGFCEFMFLSDEDRATVRELLTSWGRHAA